MLVTIRLIWHPTLLSAGAPELARLPVRPLVSPQWSPQLSGTVLPALSRAPGRAEEEIGLVGRQEGRDRSPVWTGVYSE